MAGPGVTEVDGEPVVEGRVDVGRIVALDEGLAARRDQGHVEQVGGGQGGPGGEGVAAGVEVADAGPRRDGDGADDEGQAAVEESELGAEQRPAPAAVLRPVEDAEEKVLVPAEEEGARRRDEGAARRATRGSKKRPEAILSFLLCSCIFRPWCSPEQRGSRSYMEVEDSEDLLHRVTRGSQTLGDFPRPALCRASPPNTVDNLHGVC